MRFLKLAANRPAHDHDGAYVYPYWVDIALDGDPAMVALAEGDGHSHAGGYFTAQEALSSRWTRHLEQAGGAWLRPWLERLAAGEAVSEDELVADYTRRHGRAPESYEASPRG